jgi:D-tyrosyl-tRNA(Tyr) deacylase
VATAGSEVGRIDGGLLVLVGVAAGDDQKDVDSLASKIAQLRVLPDDRGRLNRSVVEAGGAVLVVSQFTLMGDARRGRRPAFDAAAPAREAQALYEALVQAIRAHGVSVSTGVFQADMQVSLTNDGPVTILLDSRGQF